jgi:carbamoyltransferase
MLIISPSIRTRTRTSGLWRKISFTLTKRPDVRLILDRIKHKRKRANVREELGRHFPGDNFSGEVHPIEHHLAHLSSAFHVSPFDEAVAVSVDGFGDFASAAWGVGRGPQIEVEDKIYFPHSLGIFYQAMTQYLGFPHYGDEYKVMGLAPYGEPRYTANMRDIIQLEADGSFRLNLSYFRHHKEKIEYEWDNGEPVVGELFSPALTEMLGPARNKGDELTQRHKDIARSVQAMYEEAFFHLLNMLHRRYGLESLTLAGGCALNSVANGKVYKNTPFKRVYVQSAAGDAGGAIGAAFVVWHQLVKQCARTLPSCGREGENERELGKVYPSPSLSLLIGERETVRSSPLAGEKASLRRSPLQREKEIPHRFVMDHAYWGPQFSNGQFGTVLGGRKNELDIRGCGVEELADEAALCGRTARAIADGKVVGWFQGRMEWGPRALGNRSILCDPRRADMKDILNLKVKRRESFRPFASSILREAVSEWFEEEDDIPFMMQVFQIREEKRRLIPAVTHVDGSGRLQTVYRATNPRYYRLIEAFAELTGVPLVLNTSFNENEPVVCRPEEALECFLRTQMDVLVLGDYFVTR